MPRVASIPKYRHHKARNLAVVRIDGIDHYLGPWKSKASLAEYDRLIAEWMANGRTLRMDAAEDPKATLTVVELIAKYLLFMKRTYANYDDPQGMPYRSRFVLRIVREMYGRDRVREFGPLKLKAVRQKLLDRDQSRGYINENVRRIVAMFRWGVSEELVAPDVLHALEAVQGLRKGRTTAREGRVVTPVDPARVEATLPYLSPVVADMVRLQLLLGCRPGELFDLRPCDIERDSGEVWAYRPLHHKTEHHGHSRVIFIGPQAQAILAPYLERDPASPCFTPAESEAKQRQQRSARRKTPASCGNAPGRRSGPRQQKRSFRSEFNKNGYRRAITRACQKAGVAPWTPYQLRHSRATQVRKAYGLEGAQVVLGHKNARVTEVYAERDHELAARVARETG